MLILIQALCGEMEIPQALDFKIKFLFLIATRYDLNRIRKFYYIVAYLHIKVNRLEIDHCTIDMKVN